jgi:hypothetical protein
MKGNYMARQPIKKSVRFDVFKRDSFTCQYCGQKAPDVVLEVDHITPVSGGGDNDILNLVTACRACNSGKSDRRLSENAAVEKRRVQLEDLEERRQQLQMLHDWHMSLVDLNEGAVDLAQSLWFESIGEPGCVLTVTARDEIRKLIKRHGFDSVCSAIREAAEAALRSSRINDERDIVTNEWFWKIARIMAVQKLRAEDPGAARLLYIRGICRNRFSYCNERESLSLLQRAYELGVGLPWMESTAKACRCWSEWRNLMDDAIQTQRGINEEATDGTNP